MYQKARTVREPVNNRLQFSSCSPFGGASEDAFSVTEFRMVFRIRSAAPG